MHSLEYRTAREEAVEPYPPLTVPVLVGLLLPPLSTFFISLCVVLHQAAEEPFGTFEPRDAIFQLVGPLLVMVAWVFWFWFAFRRRRMPWLPLVLVAVWGVLNLVVVTRYFVDYVPLWTR
jgi:hypothetical protein